MDCSRDSHFAECSFECVDCNGVSIAQDSSYALEVVVWFYLWFEADINDTSVQVKDACVFEPQWLHAVAGRQC